MATGLIFSFNYIGSGLDGGGNYRRTATGDRQYLPHWPGEKGICLSDDLPGYHCRKDTPPMKKKHFSAA